MIIDYTKGLFVKNDQRKNMKVKYIDDLAYHLYLLKFDNRFGFSQYGFIVSCSNKQDFYDEALEIIRNKKLKKIKQKIHE